MKFVTQNNGETVALVHCNHAWCSNITTGQDSQVDWHACMWSGYFPVKLQALPEGTCINARVPVYQVGHGCRCPCYGRTKRTLFGPVDPFSLAVLQ